MKVIRIPVVAQEIGVDEAYVEKEFLELIQTEKNNNEEKLFVVDEEEKKVSILTSNDLEKILQGPKEKTKLVDLTIHFNITSKDLHKILTRLNEEKKIKHQVYDYYLSTLDKPSLSLSVEPKKVTVGDEFRLNAEIHTETEVKSPKFNIDLPDGITTIFDPKLPSKVSGNREDAYILKAEKKGEYTFKLHFEGLVNDIPYKEEVSINDFIVKAPPPNLTIICLNKGEIQGTLNERLEISYQIDNRGEGDSLDIRVVGVENLRDVTVSSSGLIGTIAPKGRTIYPLSLIPRKSGVISISPLEIVYKDANDEKGQVPVPEVKVNVKVFRPELKIEINSPSRAKADSIFPITLKVVNIGEGGARNINFNILFTPPSTRLQGRLNYSRNLLRSHEEDEVEYTLKTPKEGDVELQDFSVSYTDEEGKQMRLNSHGVKVSVGKETAASTEIWPFIEGFSFHKYRVIKQIGEGAYALIYLVDETVAQSRTQFTIKVLKKEYLRDENVRSAFIAEGNLMRTLRASNIVTVYDVTEWTHNNRVYPYIVMEYLSGGPLSKWLVNRSPVDITIFNEVIRDTCLGLMDAHDRNFIHYDIKPSNILRYEGSLPCWKISDFGLAKSITDGEIVMKRGTFDYIAPEVKEGNTVPTEKSDIYSLGVVAREMLTGYPTGDLDRVPEYYSGSDRVLLKKIVELIERMTHSNPAQRPEIHEIIGAIRMSRSGGVG